MATGWKRNTPARPLPQNWPHLTATVKRRAGFRCEHIMQHNLERCPRAGTDVDHIIERSDNGSDDLSNLQLLCEYHHSQKTGRNAGFKSQKQRRQREKRNKKHPGITP